MRTSTFFLINAKTDRAFRALTAAVRMANIPPLKDGTYHVWVSEEDARVLAKDHNFEGYTFPSPGNNFWVKIAGVSIFVAWQPKAPPGHLAMGGELPANAFPVRFDPEDERTLNRAIESLRESWMLSTSYFGPGADLDRIFEMSDEQKESFRRAFTKAGVFDSLPPDSIDHLIANERAGRPGIPLESIIREAIGEASMCWSEPPAGVFDSTKALDVSARLFIAIREQIVKLEDALIWCSGAPIFSEGGDARVGWERMVKPLLSHTHLVDSATGADDLVAGRRTFTPGESDLAKIHEKLKELEQRLSHLEDRTR